VLISIFFSVILFSLQNWILPEATIKMRALLFSMQQKSPYENNYNVDESLFRDNVDATSTLNLTRKIKNNKIEINKLKVECESILSNLPKNTATRNYNDLGLKKYGIQPCSSGNSNITKEETLLLERDLYLVSNNLQQSFTKRKDLIKEQTSRIASSIELILFFIIGAYLGFYYKNQKPFLLVLTGLSLISLLIGMKQIFENLSALNIFGYVSSIFISEILFLLLIFIFFWKTYKKDKANNSC